MKDKFIGDGITFDDVLIVPNKSDIVPSQIGTMTRLTKNINLHIPIVSAAMDTVTDSRLAIALAQEGGIGIVHKNMPVVDQAREVMKVKRSANGIILDPISLPPDETIRTAKKIMNDHHISGIPVLDNRKKLVGILTIRDLRFQKDDSKKIADVMTKTNLITAPFGTSLEQAKQILHQAKVEKLLLVDKAFQLKGLITIKDINKLLQYPNACKDGRGRLRVGAAVGVHDYDRVSELVKNDVDVIVVDTAHGHSKNVIETIKEIKKKFGIELIAGNIATNEAAEELIKAGADGIKVGIGPGSICTTRIISGVGVPQITAVYQCTLAAEKYKIPVIADGGITHSGDITKAIAAGANSVMIGSLFAGTNESPGESIIYKGRSYKAYRGMGSIDAMEKGSKDRYQQSSVEERSKLVPEGIEGLVPSKGPLSDFVHQLIGGLKAGMGYSGAKNIEELREKARFVKISTASLKESHPHNVVITKEAPNYWVD
ncbi:MAG: IMP dehydrogenase [Planctomycetes bacterium]|nr:IMP dehydrogenase [Planctomycetota bacterium]